MDTYRILEDGEQIWQGRAYNSEHAEEKAFADEVPGSLNRYTLQSWGQVKVSSQIKTGGWVTVYRDACLTS